MAKRLVKEIFFSPFPTIGQLKGKDVVQNEYEDMLISNFDSGSECELDIICNMILILLIEYDSMT